MASSQITMPDARQAAVSRPEYDPEPGGIVVQIVHPVSHGAAWKESREGCSLLEFQVLDLKS